MLVKDIMTRDFETTSFDQMLDNVAEIMLRKNVDHVVARVDGTPSVIVTRRKVILASYKTDLPLSEIPISGFGRGLDTAIRPSGTVLLSVGKLQEAEAECIPVVEDMEVLGVLTKDDIVENVSKITGTDLQSEDRRTEWTYE